MPEKGIFHYISGLCESGKGGTTINLVCCHSNQSEDLNIAHAWYRGSILWIQTIKFFRFFGRPRLKVSHHQTGTTFKRLKGCIVPIQKPKFGQKSAPFVVFVVICSPATYIFLKKVLKSPINRTCFIQPNSVVKMYGGL